MWECWNCGFQNVDAAPVCAKCAARKPEEGEKLKGRSFHNMEQSAKERYADEVMSQAFPPVPDLDELVEDWTEIAGKPGAIPKALAKLEMRQYRMREVLRLMLGTVKNPQAKGTEEKLVNIYNMLLDWGEK